MDAVQAEIARLSHAIDTAALLGGALRLRARGTSPHPDVPMDAALGHLLPGGLQGIDARTAEQMANLLAARLAEAQDFLAAPERGPDWAEVDPALMRAMGEASRMVPHHMRRLAATRPGLAAAMRGRMLDVGTGIAALALEALALEPALTVVGLDVWPEALAAARARRDASPHGDRLELREADVTLLDEEAAYTLAWLPTPFMPKAVAEAAMVRLARALKPDGWLVTVAFRFAEDPAGAALGHVRLRRCGGHPWLADDLADALRAVGLRDVEAEVFGGTTMVFGRR